MVTEMVPSDSAAWRAVRPAASRSLRNSRPSRRCRAVGCFRGTYASRFHHIG
ncbi:hypothetical protein [Streptomyces sp. NRRL F-525]|uniref:hypothetical protein n=1 Tax=Streptomyces sp. NRRL F-525 TaxID=1463861 RepID=UPI001F47F0E2|nr:hypothetical protein [Streptomyces sp. NRRL F-525]